MPVLFYQATDQKKYSWHVHILSKITISYVPNDLNVHHTSQWITMQLQCNYADNSLSIWSACTSSSSLMPVFRLLLSQCSPKLSQLSVKTGYHSSL